MGRLLKDLKSDRSRQSELMTAILGVSAFCPDAAAAVVLDGEVVDAAREADFPHGPQAGIPVQAVDACLRAAGLRADPLDHVAFHEKPLARVRRLFQTCLAYAPR